MQRTADGPQPEGAPEHCPGTTSEGAGTASACDGCPNQSICASGVSESKAAEEAADLAAIEENLAGVKERILILSGKGGVGKSSVTANLARLLASNEERCVGILDVDICGPSQAQMLGVSGDTLHSSHFGVDPVIGGENGNICIVSVSFMLESEADAVIWRGGKKNSLVRHFLKDVRWQDLDYLLVDTPPGTSDEHLALVQLMRPITGAILVTTPQEVAWQDVRKQIDFCRKVNLPILGIIENMTDAFACPRCGVESAIFADGGASRVRAYSEANALTYLGGIPLDPLVGQACDGGADLPEGSLALAAYRSIVGRLLEGLPGGAR